MACCKSVKSVVFDVHEWRMCVQNARKGKNKTAVAQVTSAHWAQTTTHTVQVWRVPRTYARIYKHTGSIQRKCTMSCFQIETVVLLCSLTTSWFHRPVRIYEFSREKVQGKGQEEKKGRTRVSYGHIVTEDVYML